MIKTNLRIEMGESGPAITGALSEILSLGVERSAALRFPGRAIKPLLPTHTFNEWQHRDASAKWMRAEWGWGGWGVQVGALWVGMRDEQARRSGRTKGGAVSRMLPLFPRTRGGMGRISSISMPLSVLLIGPILYQLSNQTLLFYTDISHWFSVSAHRSIMLPILLGWP